MGYFANRSEKVHVFRIFGAATCGLVKIDFVTWGD